MNLRILEERIEQKRRELNELADRRGLKDNRVLSKSVELDQLLNLYVEEKYADKSFVQMNQQTVSHEFACSY